MNRHIRRLTTALFALAAAAGPLRAQVAWDSPLLTAPAPRPGAGLFLASPRFGSLGVLGTWRPGTGGAGFRVGLANDRHDDFSVFGGVDFQRLEHRGDEQFPLDVGWALGVGAGIGSDGAIVTPTASLNVGGTVSPEGEDFEFTPYMSPRLVLDLATGDVAHPHGSGAHLGFVVDLGVDVSVYRGWMLRFAGTVGERGAVAVGVVFP